MEKLYYTPEWSTSSIEVDFNRKTILKTTSSSGGLRRKIKKDDIVEIDYAIAQEILRLRAENIDIGKKVKQTEPEIKIPIENGFKIRKKPTPEYKAKLIIRKKENILRIKELKAFNTNSLI